MEEFLIKYGNLKVDQFGYVYKDVEKQTKRMETFFGVPKFTILGPIEVDVIYRGKPTKITVKAAYGRLFDNTELELLEIVDGESIYTEFIDEGREGFHHVSFDVNDLSSLIDYFKSEGINVIQSGKLVALRYAYMDTESLLGIILEFSETKRKRSK
jgi:methylmalonyl-CoA/ethylmalonyl-CoA epimerase